MTPWRLFLALIAATYAIFGFIFLFNPSEMAAMLGVTFLSTAARTDFRAMYGGLEIGVGAFLLVCALRREFVRVGLFAGACALVAMATSRTVGLMLDGFSVIQALIAITEWVGGAAATWGAVMATPERDSLPAPFEDPTPDQLTPDNPTLPPAA
jgi:Domain of unknown function (DUF4345)